MVALGEVSAPSELPKNEVIIIDKNDPRAVINLVPSAFARSIEVVAEKYPHYLAESELELQVLLRPTDLDDRLRVAFWAEYERSQDNNRAMQMKNVYGPFISKQHFYATIMESPQRIAWIIKPPENHMLSSEASLHNGKNTMAKIMRMEVFDDAGNIDTKRASIFLKAYEMLENRVRGAVVQKNISAHMHSKVPDENSEEARRELEELEQKRNAIEVIGVAQTTDE